MKKAKLDLRTLLARRKTTLAGLMQSRGLNTTQELNSWCENNNISAPDAELLAAVGVKKEAKVAKPPAAKKKTSKKKVSKKKAQAKEDSVAAEPAHAPAAPPAVESKEADTQGVPKVPASSVSKTVSTRIN
jgi:hypothetical protein